MTSLFDQFAQASQTSKANSVTNAELSTSGYIHMKMEQDVPIFKKSKKEFTPSEKITHVAICNKYLVVAMAKGCLFRMDIHKPNTQDEINISRYTTNCRLTNLFLDPTGNHILICFVPKTLEASSEFLYLNRKSNKIRSTTKFRGHEITEVAWNLLNDSDSSTGSILLGTSKGLIFETEIMSDGDKFFTSGFSGIEQYWKQLPNYLPLYGSREVDGLVFDIGKGSNTPIKGLEYYRIPNSDKYVVFVATPTRLYYFTGQADCDEKPLLQQVFNKYLNIPEQDTYIQVKSKLNYSKLKFWSENLMLPNSFAWMTEEGITYAQINPLEDTNIKSLKLSCIDYPKPLYEDYSVSQKPPFSLVLTEFHVLLAYTDATKGVSLLNKDLVYEDNYNEAFGRLIDIVKDPMTGTIWAVTENALFSFKITKEERNVWQIYCQNKQFDLAKKYSKGNEAYYNQVLIKEADMLFENKQYDLSAQRYAETQSSFEEICLKFIQVNKQDALKTFLHRKLDNLKPQDKTQITMIVLWVIELYLNQLEELRLSEKDQLPLYYGIQKEFDSFLAFPQVADCIKNNKVTIYEIMASHGDKNNLIKLTIFNKDFEQLIRQHMYKNNFLEALEVLKSQNNRNLFYQFTPVLMKEVPKLMVKALIEQGRNLKPIQLLPAFVNCNEEIQSLEVIKYLEFCVEKLKITEKALHNLLLSLYAKYDTYKLMEYLNLQGQDIMMVNYDVHFALRLCREKKLTEACVQLSSLLGLWEAAVDLALTINVDLAKQIANQPSQEDMELKKKLWLKIAKHVVSGKDDIKKAMEFLQQCDLIRIEDILPFFSDFVTIDHFKEAICNSLKEYNQHIQDLKDEMEEATKSADLVRKDIQTFRNRYNFIRSTDICDVCELTLMVKPFYMFPCNHKFHSDCLQEELNATLGPAKKNKLAELKRQLKVLSTQAVDNISTGSAGLSARDNVKAEIDNIIGSECLYCGETMIRNIDLPFIEEDDYDRVMREWE